MKLSREYIRLPDHGLFRRIARRQGGWVGWTYWAEMRSRHGYRLVGMGRNAREAVNDVRKQARDDRG